MEILRRGKRAGQLQAFAGGKKHNWLIYYVMIDEVHETYYGRWQESALEEPKPGT